MSYAELFSRNIGILTQKERDRLENSCVAIAGVGGVGGIQLVALARSGIGCFHIGDPEVFGASDRNRQYGALESTLGYSKVEVMEKIIKDINPHAEIKMFRKGVEKSNLEEFLSGVDVVVDAIEYFALEEKTALYQKARSNGLYVFSAPIFGYCTSLFAFSPHGMTFEEYFDLQKTSHLDPFRLFPLWPNYIEAEVLDEILQKKRSIPSMGVTATLSGALLSAEVIFHLTSKKNLVTVPEVTTSDLYTQKYQVVNMEWPVFWDEYAGKYYDYVSELNINSELLRRVAEIVGKNKYILDAGCGTGNLAMRLAADNRIIAIDSSAVMLGKAKEKLKNIKSVRVEMGDITAIDFPVGEFEIVVSVNVLFNLENPRKAIQEAGRVLKSGGMFIVVSMLEGEMNTDKAYAFFLLECDRSSIPEDIREEIWGFQQRMFEMGGMKYQPSMNEIVVALENEDFEIVEKEKTYYNHFLIQARKK
ncbi:ThiF family adenylyltransferase [bacterium]|nr:ThiF family adenylyltransferase [bacterium]